MTPHSKFIIIIDAQAESPGKRVIKCRELHAIVSLLRDRGAGASFHVPEADDDNVTQKQSKKRSRQEMEGSSTFDFDTNSRKNDEYVYLDPAIETEASTSHRVRSGETSADRRLWIACEEDRKGGENGAEVSSLIGEHAQEEGNFGFPRRRVVEMPNPAGMSDNQYAKALEEYFWDEERAKEEYDAELASLLAQEEDFI
jgi:hypothetical protein